MRGPGKVEGNFAIESALDELSYKLGIDPIELRLRNYAEVHPQSGCPGRAMRCGTATESAPSDLVGPGATPRSDRCARDTGWSGYGMAGVTFGSYQAPCQARITVRARRDRARPQRGDRHRDRHLHDRYTANGRVARPSRSRKSHVEIGDSDLPPAPQSGGSGLAMSHSAAIHDAAGNLLQAFLDLVADDEHSPLRGRGPVDVGLRRRPRSSSRRPCRGRELTPRYWLATALTRSPPTGERTSKPAAATVQRRHSPRTSSKSGSTKTSVCSGSPGSSRRSTRAESSTRRRPAARSSAAS